MDQRWRMGQRDLSTEGKWGWGRDKSGQRKKSTVREEELSFEVWGRSHLESRSGGPGGVESWAEGRPRN